MKVRRRFCVVMLACGLVQVGGRAGHAEEPRLPSREELVRKWDLNGDGTIDEAEAEVARSRMRRERTELQLKSGLDPLTGKPRLLADEQAAERPLPVDESPAETPRAKSGAEARRLPGTRPPDLAPPVPATRSTDAPHPTRPGEPTQGRDPRSGTAGGGEAAPRSSAASSARGPTAGRAEGGPAVVTGGARAGAPARPGYGARGPRPDLNAGRLPAGPPGRRPAPASGGLLPNLRPAPAAPASRRTVDDFDVY
jgi:hypothetical protein